MTREMFISFIMMYGVPKEKAEEIAEHFDFSRPKGKWIKNEYDWYYHCSVCKENNLLHTDEANALSNYCPHCGADMRGKE